MRSRSSRILPRSSPWAAGVMSLRSPSEAPKPGRSIAVTWNDSVRASQEPTKLKMLSGNGLNITTVGASGGPAWARRILRPASVRNWVGMSTSGLVNGVAALRALRIVRHSGEMARNVAAFARSYRLSFFMAHPLYLDCYVPVGT